MPRRLGKPTKLDRSAQRRRGPPYEGADSTFSENLDSLWLLIILYVRMHADRTT